jgi:hypothetical protein
MEPIASNPNPKLSHLALLSGELIHSYVPSMDIAGLAS